MALGHGAIGQFATQQVGTGAATVFPADWFVQFSGPVRFKPGLKANEQQFAAYVPNPNTLIPMSWFSPLSEPARTRPSLRPAEQQFSAQDTQVIPRSLMNSWFAPLSEPPRFRQGLKASEQQFEARPPQLRPNPTTTGVLAAIETKDIFLAGIEEFNRVVSGEVGIHEASFTGAQIGINKVPAVTKARVSISIISS